MKIALAVHGRFYCFDLARALAKRGHEVRVLTNYPKWAARRFGLPDEMLVVFPLHGVLARLLGRLGLDWTPFMHRMFGRWAARQLRREHWDVVHVMSGIAEEFLDAPATPGCRRQVARASSHIRVQDRLLAEEVARSHAPQQRPHPWMIEREEREYAKADEVVVLSRFSYQSFLDCGFAAEKLRLLGLGVETDSFRAAPATVSARMERLQAGKSLRVLTVGSVCFRKGLLDYREIVRSLTPRMTFRWVGTLTSEAAGITRELSDAVEFIGHVPQSDLPAHYRWADVFLFPTIEDGFPVVLTQALAAGVPLLASTHCSAPDLIQEGVNGWTRPARQPSQFSERLVWADAHREAFTAMAERTFQTFSPSTWDDVAAAFERLVAPSSPATASPWKTDRT